jgi:uncharacterized delta-60 repeat protein
MNKNNKMRYYFIIFLINVTLLLNAQSSLHDPSFNTLDDCTFGDGSGFNGGVYSTAIQSDGKILVGGNFSRYNNATFRILVRLNLDGSIDSTYMPNSNLFGNGSGTVYSLSLQNDGKLIVAGNNNYFFRLNPDGSLDSTFNAGTQFGTINSTSIQSDGKIIVGGNFSLWNGTLVNDIVRLNTNGSLDSSFYLNTGVGFNGPVTATEIQSDGKILIGGMFNTFNGTSVLRLCRLNTNGTLDLTFNQGTGLNGSPNDIAIQNDGKIILVGGIASYNGTARNNILRLNSNGIIDLTFNPGSGTDQPIKTVSIQSDGKLIIGGTFFRYNNIIKHCLARINTNGTLDASFKLKVGSYSGSNNLFTSIIQNDGKIIIGGGFTDCDSLFRGAIARINSNGTLDNSFLPAIGFNDRLLGSDRVNVIEVQSDGKVLVGGNFTSYNDKLSRRLVRLNTDGSLDLSFNIGIGVYDSLSRYTGNINSIAIQNDGKILIGGLFRYFNNNQVYSIARLNPDGTIDNTFSMGTGTSTGTGGYSTINSIKIQSDGKIIIGGNFTVYNGVGRVRIARLNVDGTLDPTFNPVAGFVGNVNTMSIQSDGKIVVGGSFTSYNGVQSSRIIRLNTDGSRDITFNTGTGFNSTVNATVVQNDGKILVGGIFLSYNGVSIGRSIARLNTDGSLDNSFIVTGLLNGGVNTIFLQNNGKLVIGGSFSGTNKNKIARLNTNGSLDASFNQGTGFDDDVYAICIQNDGKILTGGDFTTFDGNCRRRIARLFPCSSNSSIINQSACNSFTLNGQTYTSSGTFTQLTSNIGGCDSTITLNLTIRQPSSSSITQSACSSYTLNGQTYTSSGAYTQVRTNAAGCDSTITLNLTIRQPSSSSITQSACSSYTLNGQTYTSTGTYTQLRTNAAGCDSTITLNLTILQPSSSTLTQTACSSYTLNGQTYTNSGTFTQVRTNTAGCDSTITLNLSITNPPVTTVNVNGNILTAVANATSYQWLNCNNNLSPIPGATSLSYQPGQSGSYAVQITDGPCQVTSQCTNLTIVALSQQNLTEIKIYPNPADGYFTIETDPKFIGTNYKIVNILGQEFVSGIIDNQTNNVNISSLAAGAYYLLIQNENYRFSLIKK